VVEISINRLRAMAEARLEGAANEREIANAEARAWAESEKKYVLKRDSERRAEWAEFHRSHARRIRATSAALIDYHETRAAQLESGGAAW